MKSYELSLVIFTICSQLAMGLSLFTAIAGYKAQKDLEPNLNLHKKWFFIATLMVIAIIASLFHLGHPIEAYRVLDNLGLAWLSREAVIAGIVTGLAILTFIQGGRASLGILTALAGLVLLLAQGMTYAPISLPAIANALPLTFFGLTALTLGAAFTPCFQYHEPMPVLRTGLWIWLVLLLVIPCVWASGSAVMLLTAQAWAASCFYWGCVGFLVLALILNYFENLPPLWAALSILIAAILGRLNFFADTISTASNLGMPY